jgi:hypothetical protein
MNARAVAALLMRRAILLLKPPQSVYQIGVQRDRSAASLLCRSVMEFDMARDAALRVDHHRPCQLGDLGAKAGLDRQQDHRDRARDIGCERLAARRLQAAVS